MARYFRPFPRRANLRAFEKALSTTHRHNIRNENKENGLRKVEQNWWPTELV
jgi:hypothetical protein